MGVFSVDPYFLVYEPDTRPRDPRAADPKKFNFNFKVLNRRIFTRRIRFFCGPDSVQINNPFFSVFKICTLLDSM